MARVGRRASSSQVALRAIVRADPPSNRQRSLARSERHPPRPRSSTFSPARRTARSAAPSPSMSSGYAPVTSGRSVAGSASGSKRRSPGSLVLRNSAAGSAPPARNRSGRRSSSQSKAANPPPTKNRASPSYVCSTPAAAATDSNRGAPAATAGVGPSRDPDQARRRGDDGQADHGDEPDAAEHRHRPAPHDPTLTNPRCRRSTTKRVPRPRPRRPRRPVVR